MEMLKKDVKTRFMVINLVFILSYTYIALFHVLLVASTGWLKLKLKPSGFCWDFGSKMADSTANISQVSQPPAQKLTLFRASSRKTTHWQPYASKTLAHLGPMFGDGPITIFNPGAGPPATRNVMRDYWMNPVRDGMGVMIKGPDPDAKQTRHFPTGAFRGLQRTMSLMPPYQRLLEQGLAAAISPWLHRTMSKATEELVRGWAEYGGASGIFGGDMRYTGTTTLESLQAAAGLTAATRPYVHVCTAFTRAAAQGEQYNMILYIYIFIYIYICTFFVVSIHARFLFHTKFGMNKTGDSEKHTVLAGEKVHTATPGQCAVFFFWNGDNWLIGGICMYIC